MEFLYDLLDNSLLAVVITAAVVLSVVYFVGLAVALWKTWKE